MKIGIFHPGLNICGGGEWVALNIIDSLRQNGHKVIVLTDEKIDQTKFIRTFGQKLHTDGEFVFPFHFFRRGDPHNVYTDMISCLILQSKCDIVIDTFTCLILPGTDVVYIHYPLFKQFPSPSKKFDILKSAIYFLPYHAYERKMRRRMKQIIFANSKFTSSAIKNSLGLQSKLLYPPLSSFFLQDEKTIQSYPRLNQVVTVSRLAPEKNLEIIPYIAKQLDNVKFLIIGSLHYKEVHLKLLRLIKNLNVAERVTIMVDLPKEQLRQILLNSKIYLHCAINEHFGISVIEAMACGCLPIVHDSGGPKEFVPSNLRYMSIDEAATKIMQGLLEWSPVTVQEMHNSSLKFSQENFTKQLLATLSLH